LVISIRYPDPAIKVNDTVKIDLATGKVSDFIRFDTGVIAMATGGRNMGRVGVITHRERHDGGFNIVHIKDAIDNEFATRESNVFVIGREKPWISLPKGKGVKVRRIGLRRRETITDFCCSSPLLRSVTAAAPTPSLATKLANQLLGSWGSLVDVLEGFMHQAAQKGVWGACCSEDYTRCAMQHFRSSTTKERYPSSQPRAQND
jgi:hypothetical protein